MKVGFISKVPSEAPSLCPFHSTCHLKNSINNLPNCSFCTTGSALLAFMESLPTAVVRGPVLQVSVPAPARALSSPGIYRRPPFADSFLSALITSTPNCPGPSSLPPVICCLPLGQRACTGLPFWLWGSSGTPEKE